MSIILIVEDHAMSRQMLKTLLGYMGHRVLEAADGSAALALARSEQPDLIISDVAMPTMDGLEFVRLLRREKNMEETPVIFYTATYRIPEARRLSEGLGRCRVIPKPSDPPVLLQNVNEMLGIPFAETASPPITDHLYPSLPTSESFQGAGLQLAALMDLSFHLVGQRDPARLLNIFCRAAGDILKCGHSLLALTEGEQTRFFLGKGRNEPIYDCPVGSLPTAEIREQVLTQGLALRRHSPSSVGGKETPGDRASFESFLVIPFATPNRTYGWFCLGDKRDGSPFSDGDEEMAVALSAQAALAYENISLVEQLKRHVEELSVSNKELESFAYSISHDLRGPLRSIDGFTKIILEDYNALLDERGQNYLRRVLAATLRMDKLIDDLLGLSRIIRRDMIIMTLDLSRIVETVARALKEKEPDRDGAFLIAPGVKVKGDYGLLTIVIENLLENAWKFTSARPSAQIEFGVLNCGLPNAACGTKSEIANPESEVVYFVRDNGVGFDMNYADKLFQPFQRLHSEKDFPGTGIGLATVARIIKRHKGTVWAESEEGKGATFYFTLP